MTVLRHWVADGGTSDLSALYERHLRILETGLPF
jgi:hypothetical protein